MISIDSKIEIYLYGGSTDMRKGIHGLAMLIEEKIGKKCGDLDLGFGPQIILFGYDGYRFGEMY